MSLKIYDWNATVQHMTKKLKAITGLTHTLSFGTDPAANDVVVKKNDFAHTVKTLEGKATIFLRNIRPVGHNRVGGGD